MCLSNDSNAFFDEVVWKRQRKHSRVSPRVHHDALVSSSKPPRSPCQSNNTITCVHHCSGSRGYISPQGICHLITGCPEICQLTSNALIGTLLIWPIWLESLQVFTPTHEPRESRLRDPRGDSGEPPPHASCLLSAAQDGFRRQRHRSHV